MSLAIDPFVMPNELPAEFAARQATSGGRTAPDTNGASFPDLLDRELDPEVRAALEALSSALSSARRTTQSDEAAARHLEGSRGDGASADGARPTEVEGGAVPPASGDVRRALAPGGRLATDAPAAVNADTTMRQAAPAPADAPLARAKSTASAADGVLETLRNEATPRLAGEPGTGTAGTARPDVATSTLRASEAPSVPAGLPVADAAISSIGVTGARAQGGAANQSAVATAAAVTASLAVRATRSTSPGAEVEAAAAPVDPPSDPRVANAAAVLATPRAANGAPASITPNARRGTSASDGVPPDGRVAERAPEPDADHGNRSLGVSASGVTRPDGREAVIRAEGMDSPPVVPLRTPAASFSTAATAAPAEAAAFAPRELPTGPATLGELPGRIEWLAQRGGGAARIELDPPQLGRMDLIVRVRGNDVEVVIAAHEPAAQAAVQAQRAQLAEGLAARDLRLGQLDVTQAGGDAPEGDPGSGGRTTNSNDGGRSADLHDGGRSADPGSDGRGRAGLASPPAGVQAARFGAATPRPDAPADHSRIDLHA